MRRELRYFFYTSFLLMVSGSARIPDELRLDDGTGMKSYVVACDELYCRPESGTAHAVAEPILP